MCCALELNWGAQITGLLDGYDVEATSPNCETAKLSDKRYRTASDAAQESSTLEALDRLQGQSGTERKVAETPPSVKRYL